MTDPAAGLSGAEGVHPANSAPAAGTAERRAGLVKEAVRLVRQHGAEPATPADVRQVLGAISRGG